MSGHDARMVGTCGGQLWTALLVECVFIMGFLLNTAKKQNQKEGRRQEGGKTKGKLKDIQRKTKGKLMDS